jgi:hypothetical protein
MSCYSHYEGLDQIRVYIDNDDRGVWVLNDI